MDQGLLLVWNTASGQHLIESLVSHSIKTTTLLLPEASLEGEACERPASCKTGQEARVTIWKMSALVGRYPGSCGTPGGRQVRVPVEASAPRAGGAGLLQVDVGEGGVDSQSGERE